MNAFKGRSLFISILTILNFLLLDAVVNMVFAESSVASLTPTRVVIPANQRSASVTLTNTKDTDITYRMSLIEMGLNEDGSFGPLSDAELHPRQRSAKTVVRFSPRQVRLKPGASQVVRVIARRSGMETGEYRSHMLLNALPSLKELGNGITSENNAVLVEASSSANVGVTIPVIVRHKNTDASVSLEKSSVDFNDSGKGGKINLQLALQGNRSAFGNFTVSLINGSGERTIAELKSFALYFPYPRERISITMQKNVKRNDFNKDSRIRVRFSNKAIDSSKTYWMDEITAPEVN